MDKNQQQIQQLLTAIADDEIATDMDLWHSVHEQVTHKPRMLLRMPLRLTRFAVAIVIFVMFTVVGYAVYQSRNSDASIPADKITYLDMEEVQESVHATLDWAYADAHRISLNYSTFYDPKEAQLAEYRYVTLQTSDGTLIPQEFGGGGGGGGGGDGPTTSSSLVNFDASAIEGTPETLDLVLTIQYGGLPPEGTEVGQIPPHMGSGGGGGGGSSSSIVPAINSAGEQVDIPERIYEFEFSVPFLPIRLAKAETRVIEANGIAVSIENVRITPSMTKFDLCYSSPNSDAIWLPQLFIDTGTEPAQYNRGAVELVKPDGRRVFGAFAQSEFEPDSVGRLCGEMVALALVTQETQEIRIVVDYLYRYPDTVTDTLLAAEKAFFAERGFDVAFERSAVFQNELPQETIQYPLAQDDIILITIHDYPDTMTNWQAQSYVMMQLFRERQLGTWAFTIALPEG